MFSPQTKINENFDYGCTEKVFVRNKVVNYIAKDQYIGYSFKQGGYWELWMLDFIKKFYKQGTNMVDMGSNIGSSALLMDEVLSDNCKVYCFEPMYNDVTFKNIVDNNLQDRLILYNCGLGNKIDVFNVDKIDLFSDSNFGAKTIFEGEGKEYNDNKWKINVFPLDYFNIDNVSLIKMDVEGMEKEVLEGAYNLIEKNKPTMLVEIQKLNDFLETDIYKKIKQLGYKLARINYGYNDYILFL